MINFFIQTQSTGVMAWAISTEVVLGAKREAQRRNGGGGEYHHDYHFKIPNVIIIFLTGEDFPTKKTFLKSYLFFFLVCSETQRYDYTRFTNAPPSSMMLPQKPEMLVEDFSHNHRHHQDNDDNQNNNLNAFQQRLETLSKEFINRRTGNCFNQRFLKRFLLIINFFQFTTKFRSRKY